MACYLRVFGENLDADALVSAIPLTWDDIWRKGAKKTVAIKDRPPEHLNSGVQVLVPSEGDDVDTLVAAAILFLREHEPEMRKLSTHAGVERVYLDFAVFWKPDSAAQFSRLPPELLALAGGLGFWVELSHYLTSSDGEE